MTHLEATAEFRAFLKTSGIKARCRKQTICGVNSIQVYTTTYNESYFTPEEIKTFCEFAISKDYRGVRGDPINLSIEVQLTGKNDWNFHIYV